MSVDVAGIVTPVVQKFDPATGALLPLEPFDHLSMSTKVYLDGPRTPEELEEAKDTFTQAARLMCDYTDGLVSLDKVTFVTSNVEKRLADVVWYRQDERAYGALGGFGRIGTRLHVYGMNGHSC